MNVMRTLRNSIFLKVIAFILHQIFFIIIVLLVFTGITYWNYDDASFDIFKQDDFTKTNYYKRLVEDSIYSLVTYLNFCDKFQTDGGNDTTRIVDIYDYVKNDRITGETTISLGYAMQDLLDWYEDGFKYISVDSSYGVTYEDGEWVEENTHDNYQLVETYTNEAGISILAYAQLEQVDYREVYEILDIAAGKLRTEYKEYKKLATLFKSDNTNLQYVMLNMDSQKFYTNMDISEISQGMEAVRNLETYVILNSGTADFKSNIFYSNDRLNQYLNAFYLDNQDCILAVGVDTQFLVLDTFHKEELRYNNFEKWFRVLYKLLLVSVLGYLVCFIYLSIAAGHKKGNTGITLTFLEKLKTEILLMILLVGEFYFWNKIRQIMSGFSFPSLALDNPLRLISLLLFLSAASLLIAICYLSFLRRWKAKILWTESLLKQVLGFGKRLFLYKHLVIRTAIFYVVYISFALVSLFLTNQIGLFLLMLFVSLVLGYFIVRDKIEKQMLIDGCQNIAEGDLEFQIDTMKFHRENKHLGDTINQISHVLHEAVEDSIKNERLKTNLITNVSHDIKTPLTSIINYVSLLKNISLEDEKANQYIQILEDKSQRLQHLTEDLVEASKISSKNITLDKTKLDFVELITQTSGEFYERFQMRNLTLVTMLTEEPVLINADGKRIWRILENVYGNALKYSLENSRVYAKLEVKEEQAVFSLKNVSEQPLDNMDTEDMTKRFVRGDVSRSTQGSGLGLSIAKDLTELHEGNLKVAIDGDLFGVIICFPLWNEGD